MEEVKDYAIFMLDTTGKVLNWNEGARKIKGYTAGEIIGQHFSVFYTSEDLERGKPNEELTFAVAEGRWQALQKPLNARAARGTQHHQIDIVFRHYPLEMAAKPQDPTP